MKILHLIYAGLGGHTSVFFAHAKFAKENNIDLIACLYGIEEPLLNTIESLKEEGITHKFIKKKKGLDFLFNIKVFRFINKIDPHIVFLHTAQPLLPLKIFDFFFFKSRKYIVRETQALTLKTRRQNFNSAFSLLLADRVIFLSETYQEEFLKKKKWMRRYRGKSKVILNGLDVDKYSPDNKVDILRNSDIVKIGMVSRLVPIKDYYTVIDAIAQIVENGYKVEFHIGGDGQTFNEIKEYIELNRLQEYVIMHGLLSPDEIVLFLQNLNIYVHSSYGETMSNSIMQAQSCGLPIIASDVFGINNVIKNGENGLLFPLKDKEALVNCIENLIKKPEFRAELGRISRKFAIENLSDSAMFRSYFQVFSDVI